MMRMKITSEQWSRFLLSVAAKGSALAKWRLYHRYLLGRGVTADLSRARHYLESAAEQLYPDALFILGRNYYYGWQGYPQDVDTAYFLFCSAGRKGSRDGSFYAAMMLGCHEVKHAECDRETIDICLLHCMDLSEGLRGMPKFNRNTFGAFALLRAIRHTRNRRPYRHSYYTALKYLVFAAHCQPDDNMRKLYKTLVHRDSLQEDMAALPTWLHLFMPDQPPD